MAETSRLGLPLLQAGQAQKHVVVNEALARIDALSRAAVRSRSLSAPPGDAREGELFIVAPNAAEQWEGRDNALAAMIGGGWIFPDVEEGRRFWISDESVELRRVGGAWVSALGAGLTLATMDVEVEAGESFLTPDLIPEKAIILGVGARVAEELVGTGAHSWRLGAPGGAGRYGTGYGFDKNAHALGVTSQPMAYYAPTPLLVEAESGAFVSGRIRFAVYGFFLTPPAPL